MARLAFLPVNDVVRLEIRLVLLPSCSRLTHCSNTQKVIRRVAGSRLVLATVRSGEVCLE
jgi:hypothetical protein